MGRRAMGLALVALGLWTASAGCYGGDIRRLESELASAKLENARLAERASRLEQDALVVRDSAERAVASTRAGSVEMQALHAAWERFARDYSPTVRAELEHNLDQSMETRAALEQQLAAALATIQQHLGASEGSLAATRQHEATASALRDQTSSHEAEARASNVVEVLRAERQTMMILAQSAEARVGEAAGETRRAHDEAQAAREHADAAAAGAHQAAGAAHQAADAASAAESYARGIGRVEERVDRVDRRVDEVHGRLGEAERAIGELARRPPEPPRVHAQR